MVSVFFARAETCGIYSANMDSVLERAMESSEEWLENVLRELDLCRQKLLQELAMCGITPKQVEERKEQGEEIDDASVEPFHKVLEELTNCRERIRKSLESPMLCDMGVQQQHPTYRNIMGHGDTGEIIFDSNVEDRNNTKELNSPKEEQELEEGDEGLPAIVEHVLAELASCRENIKAAMNVQGDSGTEDEQVDSPYAVAVDGDCSVEKVWQEFKDCRVKIRETLRNELGDWNVDLDGEDRS